MEWIRPERLRNFFRPSNQGRRTMIFGIFTNRGGSSNRKPCTASQLQILESSCALVRHPHHTGKIEVGNIPAPCRKTSRQLLPDCGLPFKFDMNDWSILSLSTNGNACK